MTNVAALGSRVACRNFVVLALALVSGSCDDGSSPDLHIARVEVNLASPTLLTGSNASAIARAFDISGDEVTDVPASWRSSAPEIVSVDRSGVLTGHTEGSAVITATIGGVSGSAPISVVPLPVASVTITPAGGPLDRGQTLQLRAVVRDQFGDPIEDRPVVWKSTFPGIAQVTSAGLVIAIAAGTAEITATSEEQSATVTINVVVSQVPSGPSIESIAPSVLIPGATATIRGANFGSTPGLNDVRVAGVPAAVLAASTTELTVQLGTTGYGCEPTRQIFVQVARGSAADAQTHLLQSAPQRLLAVGESAILSSLTDAQCFELAATGGRYVISVYNTSTTAQPGSEVSFRLRGVKGLIPSGVAAAPFTTPDVTTPPAIRSMTPVNLRALLGEGRARNEAAEHARILEMNIARLRQMPAPLMKDVAGARGALASVTATQPVGSIVPMKVPDISKAVTYCTDNFPISTRVAYNGTRAIILEDINASFAGQMDTIFQKVGKEFDDVMYDMVRTTFGDPLRMDDVLDNNGKIIMLFSPRINQFAGVVGFVVTCDFETVLTAPSSNHAEVFYARVPTDVGSDSANDRTRSGWYRTIRATIIHEVKHIASFAARTRDFGRAYEDAWLEEGTARIAEEIWARAVAYDGIPVRSNSLYENTLFCDIRPSDPAAPQCAGKPYAIFRHFRDYFPFMRDPETHSPLGPKPGFADNSWYGSSWSLIRWTSDNTTADEPTFFGGLVRTSLTGVNNLVTRAGRSWEELLGEWALAQYVDDIPGFSPANPRLTIPSWNLRSIFAGMNADTASHYNPPFPLVPRAQTFGNFTASVAHMPGGGFSVFELSGAQTGRQLIQIQAPTGGDPSPKLRVAIVRTN